MTSLADVLFGKPLATDESEGERVGALAGVPILGLDALASAAYGPEAMLTVLLPLGLAGLQVISVLTALIIALLLLVFLSYRQTIGAYPAGGGAYTVAKENLGTGASLLAAAALALDYLLNVAVAIAAGVGALVSMLPALLPHTLLLCLLVLALLTLINLRGVRATGLVFMLPTWSFVGCLVGVLGYGALQALLHGGQVSSGVLPRLPPSAASAGLGTASSWLLLRAFASGCTAMTGVEAVSNGVPIFRPPQAAQARRTLTVIIAILGVLLAGEALLCRAFQIVATPPDQPGFQSVLSLLTAAIVGRGALYYLTLGSVVSVLGLSANTSFADFPRLCSILANDKFLPEPLVHRGRRLVFSHGIIALSLLSALLLVVFQGVTDRLIPLFAIGAFLAFTLSQASMVAHWRSSTSPHKQRALALNAVGALATGATCLIMLLSKLREGAWISLLLIAGMLTLFLRVRRHYDFLARATATCASLDVGPPRPPIAVVPLRRWDAVTLKALRFALGFAAEVVAVQVLTADRELDDLSARWDALVVEPAKRLGLQPPALFVLRSKYRRVFTPLLAFVTELERKHPDRQVAVLVPELVEERWYHAFLHSHHATAIKTLLLFRGGPQIVIVSTPWYLKDWLPEHRRLHLRSRKTA